MASGNLRDLEQLERGLTRWIAAHPDLVPGHNPELPPPEVTGLSQPSAGLANETVLVSFGRGLDGMVVRLPPLEPSFPVYDLATQARVQNEVAAAGVRAPSPAAVEVDERWLGAPFMVMPRVAGTIPGPAPVFDRWLMALSPADQRRLHHGLIDTLVAVHRVAVSEELAATLGGPTVSDALDYWEGYVEWAGDGSPLGDLVEALAWCRRELAKEADPDGSPPVLLWGDPRLGNLVFDEQCRVHAVLDWELASLGPPAMDLGWYFGLDAMMDELFGQRVPGFPERAEALARYEEASDHMVEHLAWHEVFALTRALAVNDRQQRIAAASGQRYVGGRPSDQGAENPLVKVLRRRMDASN
jgi:aminoglycoside phosphotransferase (APT) family kinase protein